MWGSKKLQDKVIDAKETDAYWVEKAKLNFALDLDKCRKEKGLSGKTLAEKLGTSAAYISKVFRGDANLTLESMVKLAHATGAKVEIRIVPESTVAEQNASLVAAHVIPFGKQFTTGLSHTIFFQKGDCLESSIQSKNAIYEEVA
jgi:transcriptional regulator with XRE-family HTH domain